MTFRRKLFPAVMLLIVIGAIANAASIASAQVHVRGYTNSHGTYVAQHSRSNPDGNFNNNWSTKGNINPSNGKLGTRVTPPNYARDGTPSLPTASPQSFRLSNDSSSSGTLGAMALTTVDAAQKPSPSRAELQSRLELLKQRGVDRIYRDGDGYIAIIDNRVLHVGDKVSEFTVTAIDATGVRVELRASP